MKVWERGAGMTLACGTGACACLVAASITGRTSKKATVHLDGGDLEIYWNETTNHIFKTGPAVEIFRGVLNIWTPDIKSKSVWFYLIFLLPQTNIILFFATKADNLFFRNIADKIYCI